MGKNPVISASVSKTLRDKIDRYAEQKGISRSEAARKLIEQGLEVNESGVTVIYGDSEIVTDGGSIRENQKEFRKTQKKFREKIEQRHTETAGMLILAVIWMGIVSLISVSDIVILISGILLVGILGFQVLRTGGIYD